MNKEKLAKMYDFRVKTRLYLIRHRDTPCDDIWIVEKASTKELRLLNRRTHHSIILQNDAIHDFRFSIVEPTSDKEKQGILKLLGYIWVRGMQIGFEPLSLPVAEFFF